MQLYNTQLSTFFIAYLLVINFQKINAMEEAKNTPSSGYFIEGKIVKESNLSDKDVECVKYIDLNFSVTPENLRLLLNDIAKFRDQHEEKFDTKITSLELKKDNIIPISSIECRFLLRLKKKYPCYNLSFIYQKYLEM